MKYPFFCGMKWGRKSFFGRGCWFRIYGCGLHISTRKKENAFFSERNGWRKAVYVFGLRFEILRREA